MIPQGSLFGLLDPEVELEVEGRANKTGRSLLIVQKLQFDKYVTYAHGGALSSSLGIMTSTQSKFLWTLLHQMIICQFLLSSS